MKFVNSIGCKLGTERTINEAMQVQIKAASLMKSSIFLIVLALLVVFSFLIDGVPQRSKSVGTSYNSDEDSIRCDDQFVDKDNEVNRIHPRNKVWSSNIGSELRKEK